MFWKKKTPAKLIADDWAVYSYGYSERLRAIISFDVAAAQEEKHVGYNHSVRVVVRIPVEGGVQENGLPVKAELPHLDRLEDDLLQVLQRDAVDCRFVGRMTYGGMRELVFQVENVAGFRTALSQRPRKASRYDIEVIEGAGWKFFDEKIRPAPIYWQQIGDYNVIDNLIKAGSNPNLPHVLEHVFIGDRVHLEALSADLHENGFSEISFSDNCLVMGRESRLELDEVFEITGKLFSYCADLGIRYDGWGAAVTK